MKDFVASLWQQYVKIGQYGDTFKPSAKPGPRKDLDDVLLALSKLDLKISGSPSLEVKGKMWGISKTNLL